MGKKPFSGKQKKDQLKIKKERKRVENEILEFDSEISLHDKRQLAKEIIISSTNNNSSGSTKQRNLKSTVQKKLSFNSDEINGSDELENSSDSSTENEEEEINNIDEEEETIQSSDKEEILSDDSSNFTNRKLRDIENQLKLTDFKKLNKKKQNQKNSHFKISNRTMFNNTSNGRNRLVTIFEKESREDVRERKLEATIPLDTTLRLQPWLINQRFNVDSFIDIPKRLNWSFNMSPERLKEQERNMFMKWLEDITNRYDKSRLNYFEHNLEVWRQLWRVSERSDIILLITDARYPLFHFPPALYNYIVNDLKKPMVLVLNKIDLVDKRLVGVWIDYFKSNYPGLSILSFTSFTAHENESNDNDSSLDTSKKRKLKRGVRKYESSRGKQTLIKEILSFNIKKSNNIQIDEDIQNFILENNINLESDNEDISEDDEESPDEESETEDNNSKEVEDEDEYNKYRPDKPSESMITVGMLGHPNVGKSSLINGLMGRKVVSTSRSPGHTKHFQTILLSKSIQLCDCPGLVFPALDRPKPLQILCGIFPIAQVREPYSAIRYLAERVPLEKVYSLENPEGPNKPWSPFGLCEAFAKKRGYIIANTKGAEDTHRAGLEILRDCVDGNVVISWPPPNFTHEDYIKCGLSNNINDNNNNNNQKSEELSPSIATVYKPGIGKKKQKNRKKVIHLCSISDQSDDESKFQSDDEAPLKVYKKNLKHQNPSHFKNSKSIGNINTEINSNNSSNSNQNLSNQNISGKNKKLSAKALEYQERLAEKQNKGGNKRQIL